MYTPATKLPSLALFQWSTVSAPNPRLAAPIDTDDTVLTFTSAPTDYLGAVVTGNFLMNCTNESGFTELMYVPAGGMSADGLTATGVVRGVRISGLDYTTGSSSFADTHEGDAVVGCAINAVYAAILAGVIQGTIATNGVSLRIGDETDSTVTLTFAGLTDKGFLRRNASTNKVQFSNDGTTWTNIDSVSSSNLVAVSAADTTPGYLSDKLVSATGGIDFNILNPGANETINLTVDLSEVDVVAGPLANICSDVTSTATELNRLSGISANVTSTNLNTLTAGASSNADSLHSHTAPALSGIAGETITVGQSLDEIPYDVNPYNAVEQLTQLTPVAVNLGSSNTLRKYAMKIIPPINASGINGMAFVAAEQVNGATTLGAMTITIQTDNAGQPSGTPVTNATATISQVTQRTWNTTFLTRGCTFAGAVSLTKGTTYWIVWECAATDAANYIKLGDASSYDENYVTFTRLTYNLDTTSWGSSTTTAPLFFKMLSNGADLDSFASLGSKLVPTDANFGRRCWNFVGFAAAGYSADATVSYYHDIVPAATFASAIEPDRDYFISATAGAITTTKPSAKISNSINSYKIGRGFVNSSGTVDFKINKGEKFVWNLIQNLSATTTTQIILWFKLNEINFRACQDGAGTVGLAWSDGLYDGTNNNCLYIYDANSNFDTAKCYFTADGANTMSGVCSALTDIGVTLTSTEANTVSGTQVIWKAYG